MSSKQKILESALKLFMKYGVKSVSMDDIASKLGLSKKTIYNFIENKKDLIFQVMSAFIKADEAEIQKLRKDSVDAVDEMIIIAKHVLQFLREMKPSLTYDLQKYHPQTWALIEKQHFSFIKQVIRENVDRGIKEGLYREALSPILISEMYVGLARNMTNGEVEAFTKINLADLYIEQLYYHINGVVNKQGQILFKKYLKNLQ